MIQILLFQAEIHAHVSRVEVIAHVEATLLGDPAHLLRGYGWFGKLIPTCGLRRRIGSALKCRAVFRTLTASKGILLFYSHLPNKKLVIYPNKESLICSPCFNKDNIGREIVKDAKQLVLQLNSDDNMGTALEKVSQRQDTLEKKMDQVLEKLDKLASTILNKY